VSYVKKVSQFFLNNKAISFRLNPGKTTSVAYEENDMVKFKTDKQY